MSTNNSGNNLKYGYVSVIPPVFRNEESGELISNCVTCDKYLLNPGTYYLIEKAIRTYPVIGEQFSIFEYAICFSCAQTMQQKMSQDSLKKIQQFHLENNLLDHRRTKLQSNDNLSINDWVGSCIFSGDKVNAIQEYQIFAQCNGTSMLLGDLPYMVSGAIIEQMSEILSQETKDEMDDFIDENFGLPPEWKKALKERDVVLI